jgi:type II secretory ATPase GspE/PulE/Tfp pilus assembly ATPase PilB-like protein
LRALGTGERNIASIEDPVEFSTPFIRQMRVDEKHGVTLNSGLRTLLRMDPDVLLVSEIRDPETAETVMRAASAGRYVISTMHARDAAASLATLEAMRVSRTAIAATLAGIVSQRLVRTLCVHCRRCRPTTVDEQELFLREHTESPVDICEPVGCAQCRNTGFGGRISVSEAALIDDELADLIRQGAIPDDIRRTLRAAGVPSLIGDALIKVRDGAISLQEAETLTWV